MLLCCSPQHHINPSLICGAASPSPHNRSPTHPPTHHPQTPRLLPVLICSDTADATAALQLDGIPFRGNTLKIKRPKDYVPAFGVRRGGLLRAAVLCSVAF